MNSVLTGSEKKRVTVLFSIETSKYCRIGDCSSGMKLTEGLASAVGST